MLGYNPEKFQDSSMNGFRVMRAAKLKMAIFSSLSGIFQNLQGGGNPKYGGAQQLMLGNNPVKFQVSSMNGV